MKAISVLIVTITVSAIRTSNHFAAAFNAINTGFQAGKQDVKYTCKLQHILIVYQQALAVDLLAFELELAKGTDKKIDVAAGTLAVFDDGA
ncbi:hypothetical protein ABVQ18_18335 [Snodgrassella alvi]|uniref:hypothetical protein n=1 Tax=Snodgrassella alvi TaxID=1196083 RepID=UPI00346455A0